MCSCDDALIPKMPIKYVYFKKRTYNICFINQSRSNNPEHINILVEKLTTRCSHPVIELQIMSHEKHMASKLKITVLRKLRAQSGA